MKPAIEVSHLTKEYRLGAMRGLRQGLANAGRRLLGRPAPERQRFLALDDVSFTVQPGEVVGVIGHNGAGKSTLLKMISRITTPTSGSVKVNGRIAPLIEVGAGFVADFTGRENVYLNGAILGLKKTEIDRKFDEIVAFAEMEQFIDTPVKRYSSGMQVKLAFAVATSIDSEILIVDEVLAVGDLAFQRKCFDRMEDLIKRQGRTVLLVSHNIRQVERMCKRVIVLGRGRVLIDTTPDVGCNFFFEESDRQIAREVERKMAVRPPSVLGAESLQLESITLLDAKGAAVDALTFGEPCVVRQRFRAAEDLRGVVFGLGVHTPDLLYIAIDDSILSPLGPVDVAAGEFVLDYRIAHWNILPGTYAFRVGAAFAANDHVLMYAENLCHFQVRTANTSRSRLVGQGLVPLGGSWAAPAVSTRLAEAPVARSKDHADACAAITGSASAS